MPEIEESDKKGRSTTGPLMEKEDSHMPKIKPHRANEDLPDPSAHEASGTAHRHPYTPPRVLSAERLEAAAAACVPGSSLPQIPAPAGGKIVDPNPFSGYCQTLGS
jgi:hypothetical protein